MSSMTKVILEINFPKYIWGFCTQEGLWLCIYIAIIDSSLDHLIKSLIQAGWAQCSNFFGTLLFATPFDLEDQILSDNPCREGRF